MTLFEEIISPDNLYSAYLDARANKRYRSSILKFEYNLEENLIRLRQDILSGNYKHGGYHEFVISDSKKRTIKAAPFRDRVVHHAVCSVVEPIIDKGFIFDTCACRFSKGSHKAVIRIESFIRSIESRFKSETIYCLKCDIRKYFESINHEVLFGMLKKRITDEKILWLLWEIIRSNPKGIPIGNLTSQLFANIYLNELDHFVKRELKERYYIRYMDDFLILGTDKRHLAVQKERIREFLREKLKLELHPRKAEIFPVREPVASNGTGPIRESVVPSKASLDFLGYVLCDNVRFLRKSTVKRFINRRKRYARLLKNGKMSKEAIESSEKSWLGYAKFADSWGLRKKLGI